MSDRYDPYEDTYEESYGDPIEPLGRRRNAMVRTVALIVLLAFGATYAAVNLNAFLRNRDVEPVRGQADARGFRFLLLDPETGAPVRYDPCSPIHYVINPANAPDGGIEDVHEAFRITSEATQLQFRFDGLVNEPVEARERDPVQAGRYGRRWAPILVGWIPFDASIFETDDVGIAGSLAQLNAEGHPVYVTGRIIMNGADHLANGFRPGKTWGKVMLHELGHVLGLDHVTDPAQVMNPDLVSSAAAWGTGDLAGLTRIGSLSGCLEVPEVPYPASTSTDPTSGIRSEAIAEPASVRSPSKVVVKVHLKLSGNPSMSAARNVTRRTVPSIDTRPGKEPSIVEDE